jgi:hypothetical protein
VDDYACGDQSDSDLWLQGQVGFCADGDDHELTFLLLQYETAPWTACNITAGLDVQPQVNKYLE